jgi:hypothetical protein
MNTRTLACLPTLGLTALVLASAPAAAGSSSGADEYLAVTEAVAPNVLFVLDLSGDMDDYCDDDKTETCLEVAVDVMGVLVQHYDWARYGVVGTADRDSASAFEEIVPLGSPYSEFSKAIASVTTHGSSVTTRNLAETLASVGSGYLTLTATEDETDDDSDGFTKDWDESSPPADPRATRRCRRSGARTSTPCSARPTTSATPAACPRPTQSATSTRPPTS